ncbi:MAG: AAA family ATPase, partial [Acidimicrobiales bacterium]|nr:AAA family ATPase [Acidimicrobiales bacterium]
HYIAYRAQARAKVAAVRWSQGDTASAATAAHLLALGHDHLREARVRLVLVGGGPGTGKSTVARGIAAPLDALMLRSDEVRKSLAGLDPLVPSPAPLEEGLYRPAMTDATYTELLARARTALELGRTVVLDATWRDPRWREAAAGVASAAAADLVELRCVAPLDLALERVRRRSGTDASDATEEVTRALSGRAGEWSTAREIDTSGDASAAISGALRRARR